MQQGKHQEYEKKLYEQYNIVLRYYYHYLYILFVYTYFKNLIFFLFINSRRPDNSPPIQNSSSNNGAIENLSQNNKESWPSLNNGNSRNQSPGNKSE